MRKLSLLLLMALAHTMPAIADVQLAPDLPSGQPVGTPINWTVTATGTDPMDYRLSIAPRGEPLRVVYDFRPENVFQWTPIEEREYLVVATVRNLSTGETHQAARIFAMVSREAGGPVVTHIDHALVALYSAPACPENQRMRVLFQSQFLQPAFYATAFKPCTGQYSMNFYVAGMREQTRYTMRHQVVDASGQTMDLGQPVQFVTEAVPVAKATFTVEDPPGLTESLIEMVLLQTPAFVGASLDPETKVYPMATDLKGHLTWYYLRHKDAKPSIFRPVAGGTFLSARDQVGSQKSQEILAEIDLAGYVVRQTNARRIQEQLFAMGFTDIFTGFHHEARRLPTGQTVALGYTERIVTDVQGPGPVDVIGDYIVALDEDFQVIWAWNAYDHLDLSRIAVLGEKCPGPGCPDLSLAGQANDWLHANSIDYSTVDGSLLLSSRHQDWVLKIDYQNGSGSGAVLWRLGPEGDFNLTSTGGDPFPFHSHQHDVNYIGVNKLIMFDNGNTRCALDPTMCFSRGQVYSIDQSNMTATLELSQDLGSYSLGVGSAQELANGNFHFDSGLQLDRDGQFGTSQELLPDGTETFRLRTSHGLYRSFRMVNLYTPTQSQ
ncbi:MAG: aryl-sulfate sulfotransferase [Acidobacteriota bacterium]